MCSGELLTGSTSIFVYPLVAAFLLLLKLIVSTFSPLLSSATVQNDIYVNYGYKLNVYSLINKVVLGIVSNKKKKSKDDGKRISK